MKNKKQLYIKNSDEHKRKLKTICSFLEIKQHQLIVELLEAQFNRFKTTEDLYNLKPFFQTKYRTKGTNSNIIVSEELHRKIRTLAFMYNVSISLCAHIILDMALSHRLKIMNLGQMYKVKNSRGY